jgi:O-antigen ligase
MVVGSGLAVAIYALCAQVLFGDKLFGVFSVPTVAPFGPFVNKNHFAGYVEMTALLALGLAVGTGEVSRRTDGTLGWVESSRAGRVILVYGAAAVLFLSVLVSFSRGGALSLAAGSAAFAAMRSLEARGGTSRWRVRAAPAVLVFAASVTAVAVIPDDARHRLQTVTAGREDAATAYRLGVWRDSIRLARASPLLGHGLGTFVDALPRFKSGAGDQLVEHAENDYLELLAEGGVVGAGLAGAAIVGFARAVRRRRSARTSGAGRALAQGAVAGFVALGVHSVVDFNLRIPANALVCAYLAAAVLSRTGHPRINRPLTYVVVALCALVVLIVTIPPSSRDESLRQRAAIRAREHVTPLRLVKVREALEGHLRRRPADAEAWVWLGWSHRSVGAAEDASALCAYGATLDPQRTALRAAVESLAP